MSLWLLYLVDAISDRRFIDYISFLYWMSLDKTSLENIISLHLHSVLHTYFNWFQCCHVLWLLFFFNQFLIICCMYLILIICIDISFISPCLIFTFLSLLLRSKLTKFPLLSVEVCYHYLFVLTKSEIIK